MALSSSLSHAHDNQVNVEFKVGQRIQCDGHRATVLFVGEVPPTKGTWLGVEWDDPSRGKHSGYHQEIKYFETRNENAGSFLRINKVDRCLKFGEALTDRYLNNSDKGYVDHKELNDLKDEMNAPFLELVGLDKIGSKQSQLQELIVVVLNQMCINDTEDNLKDICPLIRELDLSLNLFDSWVTVAKIAEQLQHLALLNISGNKLTVPTNPQDMRHEFSSLKNLVMGNMNYGWKDIMQCSFMWPGLETLSVPNNRITQLEFMNSDMFAELKMINLEGNQIENWEEINKLGQLPNLEQLSLLGVGLKNIQVKENTFPKLSKLSLTDNKLSQWHHVSELDKLPSLTNLKMCGNDGLHAGGYETFLQWVIARIGKLQVFNGTTLTAEERRGAELDYIKLHGEKYFSVIENPGQQHLQDFFIHHPRYNHLIKKYGPPEKGELEVKSTALKNTLLSLKLMRDTKCIEKKLPSTMAIQKLKTLCQRLFNLDSSDISLYAKSSENQDMNIPLDNDFRSISFYSVSNGDTIFMASN